MKAPYRRTAGRGILLLVLLPLAWTHPVSGLVAAEIIWTNNYGNGDGNWANATNWQLGRLPAAGDAVVFKPELNYSCTVSAGAVPQNLASFTIEAGYTGIVTLAANFAAGPSQTLTVTGDFIVNGGTLVLNGRIIDDTTGEGVTLNAANFTVGSAGVITADDRGFAATKGPGGGAAGEGGTHGGTGGGNADGLYGSATAPITLGSGGADTAGGGALKVNVGAGTITVNGTITCNGQLGSWLTGWSWRKRHLIAGSSGAGTNYQVKFKLHRASGVDSGEDVYLDTKCRSDFGDLRFVGANGTTLLDYWIESISGNDAVVWVEVQDSLESSREIQLYYGNPGAVSASNGDNTFLFFDDFSSVNPAKFNYSATSVGYQLSGGTLGFWSNSGWPSTWLIATPSYTDADRIAVRTRFKTTGSSWWFQNSFQSGGSRCFRLSDNGTASHGFHIQYNDGAGGGDIDLPTIVSLSNDTWYISENRKLAATTFEADFWSDAGTLLGSQQLTKSGFAGQTWTWRTTKNLTDVANYDWFAIRKCLAAEPSHSRWFLEEATFGGSSADAGAGGSIQMVCGTLAGSGSLQAHGGVADAAARGGGGGRIALRYSSCTFTGKTDASGGTGGLASGEGGSTTPANLTLADHDVSGAAPNAFGGANPLLLSRFKLQTGSNSGGVFEPVQVTRLVFDLTSAFGVSGGDLTNIKLYVDSDNDGDADAEIPNTGTSASLSGASGTLTLDFAPGAFLVDGTASQKNFVLQADVAGLVTGDRMTIRLNPTDTTLVAGGTSGNGLVKTANALAVVGFGELGGSITATTHQVGTSTTRTWSNGGGDGLWATAANWSPAGVPQSADTVIFDGATSVASCTAAADTVAQGLAAFTVNANYTGTITFAPLFAYTGSGGSQSLSVSGDITLNAGTLAVSGNTAAGTGVSLNALNVTIANAATLHSDGLGYTAQNGPGYAAGKAGAHGGRGGGSNTALYGAVAAPVTLGSGGEDAPGGGAIQITCPGTITVNGKIRANGGPNWLSGWSKRKRHRINAAAGAGLNYQIPVTVFYGAGADSSGSVYTNSQCKTDFGDIRFTSEDGMTEYSYFMDAKTDSTKASFWVKMGSNLNSNQYLYVYYGNGAATSTSNGPATFVVFDDFNGASLDPAWTVTNLGNCAGSTSVSGGKLTVNATGGDVWSIEDNEVLITRPITGNFFTEAKLESVTNIQAWSKIGVVARQSNDWGGMYYTTACTGTNRWQLMRLYSSNTQWGPGNCTYPSYLRVAHKNGNSWNGFVSTDAYTWNAITTWRTFTMTYPVVTGLSVSACSNALTTVSSSWDWIRIRKLVDPEPTHDTVWGLEETGASTCAHGGSGGSILLSCATLAGAGALQTRGGPGSINGGGGGHIALLYTVATFTGQADATGGVGGTSSGESGSVLPGCLRLGTHTLGQISNNFTAGDLQDKVLLRFNLKTDGNSDDKAYEDLEVTRLIFDLSGVAGISAGELGDFKLYRDTDGDGNGDLLVTPAPGFPTLSLSGATGTITFEFLANGLLLDGNATKDDFLLLADIASVGAGDQLQVGLSPAETKIVAAGKSLLKQTTAANATNSLGFAELSGTTASAAHLLLGTNVWTNNNGTGDGLWATNSNWSLGRAPESGDAVVFNSSYNYGCRAVAGSVPQNLVSVTMSAGYTATLQCDDYFVRGLHQEWTVTGNVEVRGGTLALGTISTQTKTMPFTGITINAANFLVEAGAVVTGDYRGYPWHSGVAAGHYQRGGGHGGRGGGNAVLAYGSKVAPTTFGSNGDNPGNGGGGAIKINVGAGTITVNGTIRADGTNDTGSWQSDAGGAGGSIYLVCNTFAGAGTGLLQAKGGDGTGGAAGGGRIAVQTSSLTFAGNYHVPGGFCWRYSNVNGRPGTVWLPAGTNLTVNSGYSVGLAPGTNTLGNVVVKAGGQLFAHSGYDAFVDSDVDLTNNLVTLVIPGILQTGEQTQFYTTGADTLPAPLTAYSTYFVRKVSDHVYTLHSSEADALAGINAIDLTTVGTGTSRAGFSGCLIKATSFTVEAGGLVWGDGDGFAPRTGPGEGGGDSAGPSHAGLGLFRDATNLYYMTKTPYGVHTAPVTLGSGGRAVSSESGSHGTWGGAALKIDVGAGTVTVDGTIRSNGDDHESFTAAAGGSVWLVCGTLAGGSTGMIQARGGDTGSSAAGQPGGGRVAVQWSSGSTYSGRYDCRGGRYGSWQGQAGTLSLPAMNGASKTALTVTDDCAVGLAVATHDYGAVSVTAGGELFFHGDSAGGTGAVLNVDSFTVDSGGIVSAVGSGHAPTAGTGQSATGAAHGGRGVGSTVVYGSTTAPVTLGSGGAVIGSGGNRGGGAIKINAVAGPVAVQGAIKANGMGSSNGGAGGSVHIQCGAFSGLGSIEAKGGTSGGGGRIALEYASSTFLGQVSAAGGGGLSESGSILPGNLRLAAHTAGQAPDALAGAGGYTDKVLYCFKLTTDGNSQDKSFESIQVNQLVFDLTNGDGLASGDFTNIQIFQDTNHNGANDAETEIPNSGFSVSDLSSGSGTLTVNFAPDQFLLDDARMTAATTDFLLEADVAGLTQGERVTVRLNTADARVGAAGKSFSKAPAVANGAALTGFAELTGTLTAADHECDVTARTWTNADGAGDGEWGTATNWSPSGVPQANEAVIFTSAKNYACHAAADTVAQNLKSIVVNAGYTATITCDPKFAYNGTGGTQTLAVKESVTLNDGIWIVSGDTAGGTGATFNLLGQGAPAAFTVAAAATLHSNARGFAAGGGPGGGGANEAGTHAGRGAGNSDSGYGSATVPVTLGSGGEEGKGGGAIKINAGAQGTLTVNGTISANGETTGDSGAGGSIHLLCGTLTGSGALQAKGGGDGTNSRGGGGGRIALDYATCTFTGSATAAGGAGTVANGESGSVVPGNLRLAAHSAGQVADQFTAPGDFTGKVLLRFRLKTDGLSNGNASDMAFEEMEVTRLVFDVGSLVGITSGDVQNVKLYRDKNSDGAVDGGDVLVAAKAGFPVASFSGVAGTITIDFDPNTFLFDDTAAADDLLLVADVTSVATGDRLALQLNLRDSAIVAAGKILAEVATTSNLAGFAALSGSLTGVTHVIETGGQVVWTNGTRNGKWSDPGNWSIGRAPLAGDNVVFQAAFNSDCAASAGEVAQNLATITTEAGYAGTITFASNFAVGPSQTLTVTGDVVLNGGTLILGSRQIDDTTGEGAVLNAANVTVGPAAVLHADGKGFAATKGPGGGAAGQGGAHGGLGGNNADVAYGSPTAPLTLGSGGADTPGGGALKLNAGSGSITINGVVRTDGGGGLEGWYNSTWPYRKKVVIDRTQVAGSLTNFPVLIAWTADSDLAAAAQADGDDLLFTSSDGTTKLSHELEKYVPGTGQLTAWVNIPSLSSAESTVLYLYYGNSSAANQQSVSSTWTNNFRGVWHFKESPPGAYSDVTSNLNHGMTVGDMNSADQVAGKIEGCLELDGLDDYLNAPDAATLEGMAALTVSGWFYLPSWTTRTNFPLIKEGAYRFNIANNGSPSFVVATTTNAWYSAGTSVGGSAGAFTAGAWHYLVGVFNDGDLMVKVYQDGVLLATGSQALGGTIANTANSCQIGYRLLPSQNNFYSFFAGKVDECRVAAAGRSAAWVQTEYNNQNSPTAFVFRGAVESGTGGAVGATADSGAGGSIYLQCGTLAGSGLLQAKGGTAGASGYAGGGGRIALKYTTCTFTGTTLVAAGSGGLGGGTENGSLSPGNLNLAAHGAGQAASSFAGANPRTLFRFRLTTDTNSAGAFESVQVTRLVFDLSNVLDLTSGDISALKVYADVNGDGAVDGGDLELTSTGASASIPGSTGSIILDYAPGSFVVDGTTARRDFILQANVTVQVTDSMTVDLLAADAKINASGVVLGSTARTAHAAANLGFAKLSGSLTGVTHSLAAVANNWISTGLAPCDSVWSNLNNWSAGHAPLADEAVVFDGASSNVSCNASADEVAQNLASLTVNANYTGTITFAANFAYTGAGGSQVLTVKQDVVLNGGTLILTGHPGSGLGATINAANFTVGTAAVVHSDGLGYPAQAGPGAAGSDGKGGAHGGRGGGGNTVVNGSPSNPLALGSGGWDRAGGGAIKLNAASGTVTVNGTIRADGDGDSNQFGRYRKLHTLTGTAGAGNNYQVSVTIRYGSGTDSGQTVYLGGKCRTDFGDIRFTDNDGITLLSHWLESKTDGDVATFWVKVADSLDSNQDIYVYYGNSAASTASNGDSTFLFFDDFESGSIDPAKWTLVNATGWSVENGRLKGTNTSGRIQSVQTFSAPLTFMDKVQTQTRATNGQATGGFWVSTGNAVGILEHAGGTPTNYYYRNDAAWSAANNFDTLVNWHLIRIKADAANNVNLYLEDLSDSSSTTHSITNTISNEKITLGKRYDDANTGQIYLTYWEYVLIRKYAAADPGHGAWGVEEDLGGGVADSGAGGSLSILCNTFAGSGMLRARGGAGGWNGAGGGGGRIAVSYSTNTFTGASDVAGGSGGLGSGEAGSVLPGNLRLSEHALGQVASAFTTPTTYNDSVLYRFALRTDGNSDDKAFEAQQINQLVFNLTGVAGLSASDFTDVRLFQDDGDGVSDGEIVNTGVTVSDLSGGSGTLTINFGAGVLLLDDARMNSSGGKYPNFLLRADLPVDYNDRFTVQLATANASLVASGADLLRTPVVANATNAVGFAELSGSCASIGHSVMQNLWTNNNGTGNNSWSTATNWSLGRVPLAGDSVAFSSSYNYPCNAAAGSVAQNLQSITLGAGYTAALTLAADFAAGPSQALTVTGDVSLSGGSLILTGKVSGTTGTGTSLTAANFLVGAGATIQADGLGFPAGQGPGGGGASQGGAHGGRGGGNTDPAYGITVRPTTLGSGGGSGAGGGALTLSAASGTVTIDGTISADGANATAAGAGGSVYIVCTTLGGTGTVRARGGNGTYGGGGGRIALKYTSCTFDGATSAAGGTGSTTAGELGSVVPANLDTANHASGVVANAFPTAGSQDDALLYAISLRTDGNTDMPAFELLQVTQLVFNLTSVSGIAAGDISDLRLFRDVDNNKVLGGGDVEVANSGTSVSDLSSGAGTLTVNLAPGAFLINSQTDSVHFLLRGDVAGVVDGDGLTIQLNVADSKITSAGLVLGRAPSTVNAANDIGFAELAGTTASVRHGPGQTIDHYHITTSTPHTAGQGWTETLTAHDAAHAVATWDSSTVVTLSSSGNARFYTSGTYLTQTSTVTLSSGTATLYVKDTQAETMTLTADGGGGRVVTTGSIVVQPAALASFTLTATTPQTAGVGWTETLRAVDGFGNTVTSSSATVNLSSGGSAKFYTSGAYAIETTTATLSSGTATLYLRDIKAETLTLGADDGGGHTGSSGSIVVNPAGIASYTVTATSPQTAGTGWSETVSAVDAFGNRVYAANNAINLSSDGNAKFYTSGTYATQTASATLSGGGATLYIKDTTAETLRISVSDAGGKTGTSAAISVAAGAGSGGNSAPVILSGPSASPNPVYANHPTAFRVSASDADGNTLTYSWDFGDGTSAAGDLLTHAYTAAGSYPVTVAISDGIITTNGTLTVTVLPSDGDTPQLTSGPTARPNPARPGTQVIFMATAADPNGDAVTLHWDFGDGTSSDGRITQHAYSAVGTYTVGVTASDAAGHTAEAALLVVVSDTGGEASSLTLQKLRVGLNFKTTGKDSIIIQGLLNLDADFNPEDLELETEVGGVSFGFTLDAKGSARADRSGNPNNRFKVRVKYSGGAVVPGAAKFTLLCRNGNFRDEMSKWGMTDTDTPREGWEASLPLVISADPDLFIGYLDALYKAKAGSTGKAQNMR